MGGFIHVTNRSSDFSETLRLRCLHKRYLAILISNHTGRLQSLLYTGPQMDSSTHRRTRFTDVADIQMFVEVVRQFRFSAILVHNEAYVTYTHA
jgi:hypothetical protein